MNKVAQISYKALKVFGWILLALLILIIALLLFIRSPWGQQIVVNKAVTYVSDKTETEVAIDRLFITFSGNIFLEGVYLEDQKGDTLLYSKSLETGVAFLPLINSGAIHLSKLEWEGLTARVFRDEETEKFNFDFIIEAMVSDTDSTTVEATPTDTTSSTMPDVDLGPVDLRDFDISYVDEMMGIEGKFQVGQLHLDMERMDLNKMDFYIKDFLFDQSTLSYRQTKPFAETAEEDTTSSPMPVIIIDQFAITDVQALYDSEPDGIFADLSLGDFFIEVPEANLDKNKVVLKTLKLHDSEFIIKMISQEPETGDQQQALTEEEVPAGGFEWPEWAVDIDNISLEDNHILYQSGVESPQLGYFNPEAIDLENFTLVANNIYLKEKNAGLQLENLTFEEISGFELKKFGFSLDLSDQATHLSELDIATNRSNLQGEATLAYASIDELINSPENLEVNLETRAVADIRDAYFFSPELAKDPTINKSAREPITADLLVDGTMASINVGKATINWGNSTALNARGTVDHPLDTERLYVDFPVLDFRTRREDILQFVREQDLGVKIPEEIALESKVKGGLNDMAAEVNLDMPEGNIDLVGQYTNTEHIAFNADLSVKSLQLNDLLQNEQLGELTFNIHTEGKGTTLEDLDAILTSKFEKLDYRENDFSGLTLEGKMKDGVGEANLSVKGENLELDLQAFADLDTVASKYQVVIDLMGADLFALGLSSKALRTAFKLEATFEGDPEAFDLSSSISDGVVIYDTRPYQLGPVDVKGHVREDTTSLDLAGDILDLRLRSNASPAELGAALQRHISTYFSDSVSIDSVSVPVEMEMNLGLVTTPILQQVFLEGLEQLDSVSLAVDFKENEKLLTVNLDLPYILYNEIEIDSLGLRMNADADNLTAAFGLVSAEAGPVSMGRTYISGQMLDQMLHLDLRSFDEEDVLLHIATNIGMTGDTLQIQIDPEELILNKKEWSISGDNSVFYAEKYLLFENFNWERTNQVISISNDVEGVEEEHLGISFENFNLSSFTSLLNPDSLIADGALNGNLIVENLFGATGIIADLRVDSLQVTEVPLGNLSLDAKSTGSKGYDFALALKDGDIDLDLGGDYVAADSGANLNLQLDLNELKLIAIEKLSGEQIRDAEGSISGAIQVEGTTADPQYEGEFRFNEAVFTLSTFNSRFKLSDEMISVDNSGMYLNNFSITDTDNNNFTINGEVLTEDMANPTFDLALHAEEFQALNSTREDNDLFYGILNFNSDINVTGDLNQPIVNGRIRINDVSDLTFIIPETQLDIVERDGVVLFVDRENPNDILTKREEEQTASELTGVDLSAIIEVEPNAVFNVIVDENSGDNLQLGGEANLSVNMDPNGRITLSGKYEVNRGHYEMSLYNLVSRRFEIDEGSTVTWAGNPMDAILDIRAIYRVETSASELMAAQVSGADADVTSQFRQELPFIVYLNVNGDLLRPVISFGLDMPEDQQGAIGGNVYTRIQQINTQEDELNKQVFSLLVLNRFFPATGSDGSGGGTSAMARSSVSQVLSGQLNQFSNSLFGGSGLELDFDLDSFQDYQDGTGRDRTQLNVNAQQSLFNDRLVVQVGSQVDVEGSSSETQGNPVFGNVSVEYLLTENGRYRLKGFRKNSFESIIDGQLVITGLSLIFNREFNKFWELWKGIDPIERRERKKREERESKSEKEENQSRSSAIKNEDNIGQSKNE